MEVGLKQLAFKYITIHAYAKRSAYVDELVNFRFAGSMCSGCANALSQHTVIAAEFLIRQLQFRSPLPSHAHQIEM